MGTRCTVLFRPPLPLCGLLIAGFAAPAAAQEAAVPFAAAQIVVGNYDNISAVVDLDLDGFPDYVGGSEGRVNQLLWWRNAGDGTVASTTPITVAAGMGYVAVGDHDGDGHDDAWLFGGGALVPWLARPGGPVAAASEPFPAFYDVVQFADVNGDGIDEVLGIGNSRISAYSRTASGYTDLVLDRFSPARLEGFAVADYDGDGAADVWLFNDNLVWVEGLDGAGQTVRKGTFTSPFAGQTGVDTMVVAGDIDGDGDRDVVWFSSVGDCAVFRAQGAGVWGQEPVFAGGPATNFGDFDGDGDLDGLCCGGGSGPYPNDRISNYEISINDGTGRFAPAFQVQGIGARRLAGFGDLDGDGDVDLAAGRCVVLQPDRLEALQLLRGGAGVGSQWYDIEGDGDLDFGLGAGGAQFVSSRAVGDGTFRQVTTYFGVPAGLSVMPLQLVGDFDGDGDVDALMEHVSAAGAEVMLYRNFGGKLFVPVSAAVPGLSMLPVSSYSSGSNVRGPNHWRSVVDWDGDGDWDVLVTDETAGWTKVFVNDGAARFALARTFPSSQLVFATADFDGDGALDLLTLAAGINDALDVRFGDGLGGFVVGYSIANIYRDVRPGVVDLDGDGDADILTSSSQGGTLHRSNGARGFQTEPMGQVGSLNHWVFGDLDGDGRTDAVAWRTRLDRRRTSRILMQQSDGSLGAPVLVVAAVHLLGDVDGDGDVDLVGPDIYRNVGVDPAVGSYLQFGNPTSGKGDVYPTLGMAGRIAVGETIEVRAVGARGGAPGFYVLGLDVANQGIPNLPTHTLYVGQYFEPLPIVTSGPLNFSGVGQWTLQWRIPAGLGGLTLYSQAFFLDDRPASGMSQTNGKRLILPR